MMDQCDKAHDEQLKSFKHTGESVAIQQDMEQPTVISTTNWDQPSFVNKLYYPTKDNITTTTQLLAESNIAEQL
jgi:hypothetical protein